MPAKKNPAKNDDTESDPPKKNKSDMDYGSIDFESEAKTKSGKKWNYKISSWYFFAFIKRSLRAYLIEPLGMLGNSATLNLYILLHSCSACPYL